MLQCWPESLSCPGRDVLVTGNVTDHITLYRKVQDLATVKLFTFGRTRTPGSAGVPSAAVRSSVSCARSQEQREYVRYSVRVLIWGTLHAGCADGLSVSSHLRRVCASKLLALSGVA